MKKIQSRSAVRALFFLCFFAYMVTYLGRLNYSASLAEMVLQGEFSKGQAGFIGTVFFATYGCGQLINGFLGDKLSAKGMIFTGLFCSALANILMCFLHNPWQMAAAWGMNGFVQSLIWSPIVRTFSNYFPENIQKDAGVKINYCVPIGTFLAYLFTAGIISVASWRLAFLFAGIVLLAMSAVWILGMTKIDSIAVEEVEEQKPKKISKKQVQCPEQKTSMWSLVWRSGILFFCGALCVQGVLKDGVTTWIPTYINEQFHIGSVGSTMGTTVIPLFNLFGVFLAGEVNKRWFKNEIKTAGAFFGVALVALAALRVFSGVHFMLSLLLFGIATTAMMSVNTMLVSVLPMYFGKYQRAATASGVLNSSAYLGGAVSTYGIGELSYRLGWDKTIEIWALCAVFGVVFCLCGKPVWNRFLAGGKVRREKITKEREKSYEL